jgi:predicted helicase
MSTESKPLLDYVHALEKELAAGNATEHTHRTALKTLIEALANGIIATNEPQRIKCGAPDFIITKGALTVGYIEAKDVGKSLDEAEKSEQLSRYRDSLTNLILTDYLEFRWYVNGERHLLARLGSATKEGKIKREKDSIEPVTELLSGFLSHKAEAVGSPKDLALRMARLAHLIRNLIVNVFETEPESGSLHAQLTAFRDNLIPDLSVEYFADMYAQTIAYGLFAARCTAPDKKDFTRQNAAYLLPKTNPFLRKLFNHIAGPELDDRIAWLVDDLAQVLTQADMEAVLKDFGKHMGKSDPVVHFYETFLKAYDPKVREMRGVYYTPEPVVSYIVRSIDHLLKDRFGKPQGLADDKTLILDPAVGTATFLYMVINEIHNANISQGQQGTWNNYVTDKLLPRIFGFELLMAPYAVAHLKLGLLLQETGYKFESDQRLGIYLTNTLEEAFKKSEQLAGFNEYIVDEANAAAEIKKDKPIMVVLGNPPYSVSSLNRGEWIEKILYDYKQGLNETKLNLDDDYIKFIRFAQWRINKTGYGILAFITNNSYLDGLTHRRMREYLLESFSSIYILNLHGSSRRGEKAPCNIKDKNVFDIQQGVAIGIFIKEREKTDDKFVYYADMWGPRENKYQALFEADINSTDWQKLIPTAPNFFFAHKDFSFQEEYFQYIPLKNIYTLSGPGIKTERDRVCIHTTEESVTKTINDFAYKSEQEIREIYKLDKDSRDWKISSAKADVLANKMNKDLIYQILYRPFDIRHTFYTGKTRGFIGTPGVHVMQHMLQKNRALIATRQTSDPFSVFSTNVICGHKSMAAYDINSVFPLYLYPIEGEMQIDGCHRSPNLNPEFIKAVSQKLGLTFVADGKGDLKQTFGPEDIFNYAYAIFHAPSYRTRYAEFLKIDFPRLPLTSDKALFKALVGKGAELVALHLMESPALGKLITKYAVTGSNVVEKVDYDDKMQRVYINKMQYFEGVPSEVWEFHIGGYQVSQKWLKDRKGRTLSYDELTHYQKVILALIKTIRLMAEIDSLIPGWPIE